MIADELTVYRKETKETLQEYYIVYDDLRVSPAEHLYATDAMSVLEDEIKVETLATMSWLYVAGNSGDEGEAQIVCKDADGNPLTEGRINSMPKLILRSRAIRKIHFCSAGRI